MRFVPELLLLLLCCAGLPRQSEAAAACSVSASPLSFGSADTLSFSPSVSTASLDVTCNGVTEGVGTVRVCIGLDAGSGGAMFGSRNMNGSDSNSAIFELFRDDSFSQSWGDLPYPSLGLPQFYELPVSDGSVDQTINVSGRFPGGQSGVKPGSYISTVNGRMVYAEDSSLDCNHPTGSFQEFSLGVTAVVDNNCLIEAQDINFGKVGLIDQPLLAEGLLTVTCTPGTSYWIGLNGGTSGSHDPNQREMKSASGNVVVYGLYMDTNGSYPWGDINGINTISGTGSGEVTVPVYALVQPQSVSVGVYSDYVIATINY